MRVQAAEKQEVWKESKVGEQADRDSQAGSDSFGGFRLSLPRHICPVGDSDQHS